jgi:hypothetical protein
MSKRNNKTVSPPTQDNAFLPTEPRQRAECLSWVFWMQGSAPYVGGGFGHFYAYAPEKFEYPLNRFTMETKRLLSVLDRHLGGASKVRCGKRKRRQNAHRNASFLAANYTMKATLSFICEERRRGRGRRRSSVYIKTGSGQTQGKLKRKTGGVSRFTFRVSRFTRTTGWFLGRTVHDGRAVHNC